MKAHILIADDNPAIREVVSFILMKSEYNVSEAENGQEALAMILNSGKEPFDLLMTDIQMPRMSGVELIQELRKNEISLPIIALSGLAHGEWTEKVMKNGCFDLFTKPFNVPELLQRIRVLLNKRQKGKEEDFTSTSTKMKNRPISAGS